MIKAVLFDYDGTIVDTNELILNSWRYLYKKVLGRECRDEEVTNSFGEILEVAIHDRFPDQNLDELVELYRGYQENIFYDQLTIFPGMKDMIMGLKAKGFKTAIVTSRIPQSTLIGVHKFGLEACFDAIVTCADTDAHKPSPEPVQIALQRLGVNPNEAIMLGDSKFDMQCAHNAGVKGVLVNWTVCCPQSARVGNSKPEFVINKADEIYDILESLG